MRKSIKIIIMLSLMMAVLLITNMVSASSQSIILKESGKYLIYNKDAINEEFTFALSKENSKDGLIFFPSAKDSSESDAKNVAYVDETTNMYLDENLQAFLFIRDKEGNYIIDGEKINLKNAVDTELVETTTKRIEVDTTKSNTTQDMIDNVLTEVTKGKVVITDSEQAEYSYILVKLPTTGENNYSKLMDLAETIADEEELAKLDFMQKLELMNSFYSLYVELVPTADDSAWLEVQNSEILQPEDSKDGEQYIAFIKSVNGDETIIDAQFLTCYEDYNPLYEKETVTIVETSKLPVTYDSTITLLIILAVIIVAIVVVIIIRKKVNKKEENK